MRHQVVFMDTSVLLNLLDVPRKNQDRHTVAEKYTKLVADDCRLILPVTAVIETGNHIAQLPDGNARRLCAKKFAAMLREVVENRSPWTLNEVRWDRAFLEALLDGSADSRPGLVDLASGQVGSGDAAILVECEQYGAASLALEVSVWTLDAGLEAYSCY